MTGSLKIVLKRKHIKNHVNKQRKHTGDGEERSKISTSKFKRRAYDNNLSVASSTINSYGHKREFSKIVVPLTNFFLKALEENCNQGSILAITANHLHKETCSHVPQHIDSWGFVGVNRSCVRWWLRWCLYLWLENKQSAPEFSRSTICDILLCFQDQWYICLQVLREVSIVCLQLWCSWLLLSTIWSSVFDTGNMVVGELREGLRKREII